MAMFGYRGLNGFERLCVGFAFLGAGLAGFGAFHLADLIDRHLRMVTVLPGAAAIVAFFVVLTLMLKGVDEMRNERFRRLIKQAEDRQNSN